MKVTKRIQLNDSVIPDRRRSKCRFLHYRGGRLYVVDLGRDPKHYHAQLPNRYH